MEQHHKMSLANQDVANWYSSIREPQKIDQPVCFAKCIRYFLGMDGVFLYVLLQGHLPPLIAGKLSERACECKPKELAMAAWGLAMLGEVGGLFAFTSNLFF